MRKKAKRYCKNGIALLMPNIASIRNGELNSKRKYTQYCGYSNVIGNIFRTLMEQKR